MDFLTDLIVSLFNFLNTTQLLGIPLLVWFIIPLVLGFVITFLKGKKE